MKAIHEALRAAGISLPSEVPPAHRGELARLARVLRERGVRSVGLAPAGDDVAVPAVALGLGNALAEVAANPVAVVDACGSWDCARAFTEGPVLGDGTPLASVWLLDRLAIVSARPKAPGDVLVGLRRALAGGVLLFSHMVVDLTGVDHLGEQVGALSLLDAGILVARAGRTTTRQVRRKLRDFHGERNLGVLLTGL